MKMSFKDFTAEVNRIADYLNTEVTRVFNNDGNYVAHLKECAAFDRTKVTGRASSDSVTFCYGAGHTRVFKVAR